MGDIINLHERLVRLEVAHDTLVNILIEKKILPEQNDKPDTPNPEA